MCDTVFVFSQRGGYHFESPSKWFSAGLPAVLRELFKGQIRSVYCLAFGAADAFFISYNGSDGKDHIQASGLPTGLHTFLFEKKDGSLARLLPGLRVAIGPYNESYFATDGAASQWAGLPEALDTAIEGYRKPGGGWLDAPRLVALGAHGDYLYVTENSAANWRLSHYPTLQYIVRSVAKEPGGLAIVKNFAMHAYRLNSFVLQSCNGTLISDGLPPHAAQAMESIGIAIAEDTAAQARKKLELATAQQELANAQKAAAERLALVQRINQINQIKQINQVNQINAMTDMFNAFMLSMANNL